MNSPKPCIGEVEVARAVQKSEWDRYESKKGKEGEIMLGGEMFVGHIKDRRIYRDWEVYVKRVGETD